jgi:hypothetical protein
MASEDDRFSFKIVPGCDPFAEEYDVYDHLERRDIGTVRRDGSLFEVRRPQDLDYHSPLASWDEAANWLSEHFADHANFPQEDEDKDSN